MSKKKLLKNTSIPKCYKPNYIKEKEDFYNLERYIRLEGDSFEGKLLYRKNASTQWKANTKAENKALTKTDYYEFRQIEKRYKNEKFNFKKHTRSNIKEICNLLHKGKPITQISCNLDMINPHYVKRKSRNIPSLKPLKTERTQTETNKAFYITQNINETMKPSRYKRRMKSEDEIMLPSLCNYQTTVTNKNDDEFLLIKNNSYNEINNSKSVELNIQSDSEENKRDEGYPIRLRENIVSKLKEEYNFHTIPMKPYLKRYNNKTKFLQLKVFKPISSWKWKLNNRTESNKTNFINKMKRNLNQQKQQAINKELKKQNLLSLINNFTKSY